MDERTNQRLGMRVCVRVSLSLQILYSEDNSSDPFKHLHFKFKILPFVFHSLTHLRIFAVCRLLNRNDAAFDLAQIRTDERISTTKST